MAYLANNKAIWDNLRDNFVTLEGYNVIINFEANVSLLQFCSRLESPTSFSLAKGKIMDTGEF